MIMEFFFYFKDKSIRHIFTNFQVDMIIWQKHCGINKFLNIMNQQLAIIF